MQEYSARGRHELRPFTAGRATLHLKLLVFDCNLHGLGCFAFSQGFGLSRGLRPQQKQPLNYYVGCLIRPLETHDAGSCLPLFGPDWCLMQGLDVRETRLEFKVPQNLH